MRKPKMLFSLLALVASTAQAAEPVRYSLMFSDKEIGYHTVEQKSADRWEAVFHADDNGRGAKLKGSYRFSADGRPVEIDITGKSWFQAPVEEHFEVRDGVARWQTLSDKGEVKDDGKSLYFAAESLPFDLVVLARQLEKAKDNMLSLYPAGVAEVERLYVLEAAGKRFTLNTIRGVNTDPYYFWTDNDGKLAAWLLSQAIVLVRDDLDELLPNFNDAQQSVLNRINDERTAKFRRSVDGIVVFRDVKIFDSENAKLLPGRDVLAFNGRITDVRETGGALPEGAEIIEGKGATLLPGLWDVHAHSSDAAQGFANIAFGVTSVREIGNEPKDIFAMRENIESGVAIGPRQWLAGFVEGKSETAASTGMMAETLEEALSIVDWYADRGYHQIKIYNSIKPEWVEPLTERAHERGMLVSGHVPAFMIAEDAVRAGYDEINHINMLFLNFLLEEGDDTRTMLRFTRLGERAASVDLDSRRVRNFVRELRKRDVAVDPTIRVFLSMMLARPGKLDPTAEYFVERMPATWQRAAHQPFMEVPAEFDDNYSAAAQAMRDMLLMLHKEGVTIMPGTDGAPGYSLHGELFEWVRSGIPAAKVLQAATLVPSKRFGLDHEIGSIARGKRAELVLVDGDPVNNIEDLRNIRLVMQGENLFDAPAMLESLSIKP
ncbi:MAG: amidohydrolase family protein [Proteobacteria bacterium]|nr:amidohydrolase family protein [Pseudomonadota bacterium]